MNRIEAAKDLLKRIEEVDHEDLDAVNTLSCLWESLHNEWWDFESVEHSTDNYLSYRAKPRENNHRKHRSLWPSFSAAMVATSRDALKAARPEGWSFKINPVKRWKESMSYTAKAMGDDHLYAPTLESEELAEFHAIVQAWIYVWENDK